MLGAIRLAGPTMEKRKHRGMPDTKMGMFQKQDRKRLETRRWKARRHSCQWMWPESPVIQRARVEQEPVWMERELHKMIFGFWEKDRQEYGALMLEAVRAA